MNDKISVIIISGEEYNYDEIVMDNLPEWFERDFEITVIPNAQNILIDINRNNGVDVIISIGDDIDLESLNLMSFEFRKKWVHLDYYDKDLIINAIIETFLLNINRDRECDKIFSIFTCVFNTPPHTIKRLYDSLLKQTYSNWNWWIIDDSTNDATIKFMEKLQDPRIFIVKNVTKHGNIGFNKHIIAMMCDGDYLVEVDHDDELTLDCLEKLYECFKKSKADFVYSDCMEVINGAPIYYDDYFSYGQGCYRDEVVNGKLQHIAITTPNINCKSIRGIHAMPNHIRCWEKNFYHRIGGHNIDLSVADDMELMVRTFLYGRMAKVNRVLYIQHQGESDGKKRTTTTGKRFKEIQRINWLLYLKYDKEIHERIVDLIGVDQVWDDENGCSNIYQDIKMENLIPMDSLIIE